MKKPRPQSKASAPAGSATPTPAPIQLVDVFQTAVRASRRDPDLSREAIAVEVLVIAGMTVFEALNRLDKLSRAIDRERDSNAPFTRWEVELAIDSWLETASILRGRLVRLTCEGYESDSFADFLKACDSAEKISLEARERDRLKRQALRTSELGALAAKIKPRQKVYDEQGNGD